MWEVCTSVIFGWAAVFQSAVFSLISLGISKLLKYIRYFFELHVTLRIYVSEATTFWRNQLWIMMQSSTENGNWYRNRWTWTTTNYLLSFQIRNLTAQYLSSASRLSRGSGHHWLLTFLQLNRSIMRSVWIPLLECSNLYHIFAFGGVNIARNKSIMDLMP